MHLLAKSLERILGLGDDALVPFFFAKGGKLDIVVELAGDAVEGGERGFELLALAHQALRAPRVAPEIGGFGFAVEDR
jgi:hypothetical protein